MNTNFSPLPQANKVPSLLKVQVLQFFPDSLKITRKKA